MLLQFSAAAGMPVFGKARVMLHEGTPHEQRLKLAI
jgi:hypothetical protein